MSAVESIQPDEHSLRVPPEVINTMDFQGMPPHELKLKVGAHIVLLRNLDTKAGHCNGTKYIVKELSDRLIKAEITTGTYKGTSAVIPRLTLAYDDEVSPIKFKRTQFPVKLAYGTTIHKAQGQTIERIGLYMKSDSEYFTHGQLYVALSRASSPTSTYVLLDDDNTDNKVRNIVYREALI